MNRTELLGAVFGTFALGTVSAASAETDNGAEESCSQETLEGSYTYILQGHRDGRPYASAGLFSFDGAGNIAITYTSSVERTQLTVAGTYTVAPDCTGSMQLATDTVNNFYLSPNGDGFAFVRTSGDGVLATQATRVTRHRLVQ